MSEEGDRVSEEGDRVHVSDHEVEDKPSEVGDSGSGENIRGAHPGSSDNALIPTTSPVCTPPTLMPAPPAQEGGRVCLQSVVGYSGNHQRNLAWHPLRGQNGLVGHYV